MRYDIRFNVGSDIGHEEATEWAEAVRSKLPQDAEFSIKPVPLVLDLEEVTEQHAGNHVRVYLGKEKGHAEGTLEHVYVTGGTVYGRTLVIDGCAFAVPAYSSVELVDW